MATGGLKVFTFQVSCAASTSSASLGSTLTNIPVKALTISAKINNSGTIFVGSAATLRNGIPLIPGQSVDFGPVPTMGFTWAEIDTTNIKITSTSGTANKAIVTYYRVNNVG